MSNLALSFCALAALLIWHGQAAPTVISMSYCGFDGKYCGESISDDVYARTSNVLLAYAIIGTNGAVIVDADNYPKHHVNQWRNTGKRVLLSIGGPNNNWTHAFSSELNRQTFLNTTLNAVRTYSLDGVDLDIEESFTPTPKQLATTINDLRRYLNTIGRKYITLTADCVTIYQGSPVPDQDKSGQPFNYLVPVIELADSSIDYYHVKAYSNWYDGYNHTSLQYLQDIYLNWRNLQGYCEGCKPISGFKGVAASKLLLGVLASSDARAPTEYVGPTLIRNFKSWLMSKGYDMYGFHVWNSYWDYRNANQVSIAISN
jgi:chitinase